RFRASIRSHARTTSRLYALAGTVRSPTRGQPRGNIDGHAARGGPTPPRGGGTHADGSASSPALLSAFRFPFFALYLPPEHLVRVMYDDRATDVVMDRPALFENQKHDERRDRDDRQCTLDQPADDLAHRHPAPRSHPVGLRSPAAHSEHLVCRGLPPAPDDE